jgi:hypothetical protein
MVGWVTRDRKISARVIIFRTLPKRWVLGGNELDDRGSPLVLGPGKFPPRRPAALGPFFEANWAANYDTPVRGTLHGEWKFSHPFRPRNRARMPRAVQLPAGQPLNAFFMTRRVVSWRAGRAEANKRWRSESIPIPPPPSEAPDREKVEGKNIPGRARVILPGRRH